MTRTRKGPLVSLLTLGLLLPLVPLSSSCGLFGGDEHGDVEKRPEIQLPATAVRLPGEPGTFGHHITVAAPSDISTFNPYFQTDPTTTEILHLVYASLVGYNAPTGEVALDQGLAEKYEVNGNKVTIRLREGLKFSDGSDITAGDVLYSFKVAMDDAVNSPLTDMLTVSGRLPEVERLDNRTVALTFVEQYPAIGYVLSQLPIISAGPNWEEKVDKGHYSEALGISTNPATIACSGPFCIASYAKGQSIDLKYNPNYWKVDSQGKRLPYLDHIIYKFNLQPDEIVNGLKAGKVDIATNLGPAKFGELGQGDKNFTASDVGVGAGVWELVMNERVDKSLVDPVKVTWLRIPPFREALSRLIDRDKIAKEAFGGKAVPIYGPVSPSNEKWYNGNITKFPYDLDAAQKSLDSSGFKTQDVGGKPQLVDIASRKVDFNLFYPKNDAAAEAMKNIVVAGFAAKNIPLKAVAVDPSQLLTNNLLTGKFDLVLCRTDGFGPDPISYMPVFMSNGTKHYLAQTQPGQAMIFDFETDVNRLMRSQQDKTLANERQPDFAKAQKLWSDNLPVIYIVADHVLVAYNKHLGNFKPIIFQPYATWNAEQVFYKE